MTELTEIQALIDAERYDEALGRLDAAVAERETECDNRLPSRAGGTSLHAGVGAGEGTALEALYLMRGRLQWRLGRRGAAITDYEHAEALNPGGAASTLLQQARDVLDFFNPDLLNP